jgi:hypothetical protein
VPSESCGDRRAGWRRLVLAASLEAPSAPCGGCSLVRRQVSRYSFGGVVSADLCARHPVTLPLSPVARCCLLCAECSSVGSRRCAVCVRRGSVVPTSGASGRRFVSQLFCRTGATCGCALLASSALPSGVFAVPRSCPISDLWFLSCGSCDGLAAAVLLSIGLAAPAFLRLPRASPRGLLSRALFI